MVPPTARVWRSFLFPPTTHYGVSGLHALELHASTERFLKRGVRERRERIASDQHLPCRLTVSAA